MASDSNNPCDSVNNTHIILKFKKIKWSFPAHAMKVYGEAEF